MAERNVTLPVSGMSCGNCAANLERALKKVNTGRETEQFEHSLQGRQVPVFGSLNVLKLNQIIHAVS